MELGKNNIIACWSNINARLPCLPLGFTDWEGSAEITCIWSSLSLSQRSTQHTQHSLYLPVERSLFVQVHMQIPRLILEIKLQMRKENLWLVIPNPHNPSTDNDDLSARSAAVMRFVLQVLILRQFMHFTLISRRHFQGGIRIQRNSQCKLSPFRQLVKRCIKKRWLKWKGKLANKVGLIQSRAP